MKIKWWQHGVHIKPESDEERKALYVLIEGLGFVGVKTEIQSGPVGAIQGGDHESIVGIKKSPEVFS